METLRSIFIDRIGLKESHFEEYSKLATVKSLNKKEYLIQEGSVCNFIGFVTAGNMRSFVNTNNEEFNNDFYFENNFVSAYTSFLTQMPTNCTIQALTDVEVVYITYVQFNKLIAQDSEWLKLGKYISDSFFIRKCKRETSFLKNTAAERLESALSLYPGIEQKVSQYHIASYLGIKPESLSRIKLLTYINK